MEQNLRQVHPLLYIGSPVKDERKYVKFKINTKILLQKKVEPRGVTDYITSYRID